jgi:hypothetical protein
MCNNNLRTGWDAHLVFEQRDKPSWILQRPTLGLLSRRNGFRVPFSDRDSCPNLEVVIVEKRPKVEGLGHKMNKTSDNLYKEDQGAQVHTQFCTPSSSNSHGTPSERQHAPRLPSQNSL